MIQIYLRQAAWHSRQRARHLFRGQSICSWPSYSSAMWLEGKRFSSALVSLSVKMETDIHICLLICCRTSMKNNFFELCLKVLCLQSHQHFYLEKLVKQEIIHYTIFKNILSNHNLYLIPLFTEESNCFLFQTWTSDHSDWQLTWDSIYRLGFICLWCLYGRELLKDYLCAKNRISRTVMTSSL